MDVRELARAAAAAPLVLRVREFLRWVGDRRRLSREPVPSASFGRGYVYLSLGAWLTDGDGRGGRLGPEFRDGLDLLGFTLAARMLEVVVDRRDRVGGRVFREHGWVLPGPGYPILPEGATRVWRAGVDLLPVLWSQRVPGADPAAAETVPGLWLERLAAAEGGAVAVHTLGEAGHAGASGADVPVAGRLLESLGLVRFDHTLECGQRCVLTPLGRHAARLVRRDPPGTAGAGAAG